jgi:hypothetical protein
VLFQVNGMFYAVSFEESVKGITIFGKNHEKSYFASPTVTCFVEQFSKDNDTLGVLFEASVHCGPKDKYDFLTGKIKAFHRVLRQNFDRFERVDIWNQVYMNSLTHLGSKKVSAAQRIAKAKARKVEGKTPSKVKQARVTNVLRTLDASELSVSWGNRPAEPIISLAKHGA